MQSFAYKVKSELCRQPVSRQCCARAEAYGVLLYCNTFTPSEVRIITENPEFAGRLPKLFHKAFGVKFDRVPEEGDHFVYENLDVTVTRVDHRRVLEIRVVVLPQEDTGDKDRK